MIGKQIVIDILVVITLPILLIGGYFLWFRTNDSALLLSSLAPTTEAEPGAKTKQALDTLKSLTLDDSLFVDPAYNALIAYNVVVPPATTSRAYPFTPPTVIEERIRQAKLGRNFVKDSIDTQSSSGTLSSSVDRARKTAR
jgi:hypothetical protein